ncbi:hypothetical protein [Alcanivorax sp. DP30]|uniref:hypothetical protein n=1 Tax=Alcanivorax sp. DP30 TaxID=2606217 RepID=UPI001F433F9D|nr:hypothetical protein [Alcanivorax sp. DP30]
MSSSWSPTVKVELAPSRYPRWLQWLAGLSVAPVVWLVAWPWWAKSLLLLAIVLLLRGWRLPVIGMMELRESMLTVSTHKVQVLERPGRVIRLGPWLAMQTPKGWLHLFEDQAPPEQLQPIYQWLWVNRVR